MENPHLPQSSRCKLMCSRETDRTKWEFFLILEGNDLLRDRTASHAFEFAHFAWYKYVCVVMFCMCTINELQLSAETKGVASWKYWWSAIRNFRSERFVPIVATWIQKIYTLNSPKPPRPWGIQGEKSAPGCPASSVGAQWFLQNLPLNLPWSNIQPGS